MCVFVDTPAVLTVCACVCVCMHAVLTLCVFCVCVLCVCLAPWSGGEAVGQQEARLRPGIRVRQRLQRVSGRRGNVSHRRAAPWLQALYLPLSGC